MQLRKLLARDIRIDSSFEIIPSNSRGDVIAKIYPRNIMGTC